MDNLDSRYDKRVDGEDSNLYVGDDRGSDLGELCARIFRLLNPIVWLQMIVYFLFGVELFVSEKQSEIELRRNQVESKIQKTRNKK